MPTHRAVMAKRISSAHAPARAARAPVPDAVAASSLRKLSVMADTVAGPAPPPPSSIGTASESKRASAFSTGRLCMLSSHPVSRLTTPMAFRHPIFARFYARMSVAMDRAVADHRRDLLSGLAGRVVEVGVGNGLNFRHYPATVSQVV